MTWFTRGSNSVDTVKFSISNGRSKFSRLKRSQKRSSYGLTFHVPFFFFSENSVYLDLEKGDIFSFSFLFLVLA